MRTTNLAILALLFYCATISNGNCAAFQNLNFDDADTSKIINREELPGGAGFYGFGEVSDLLPGWSLRADGKTVGIINYNQRSVGNPEPILWENRNTPTEPFPATGYSLQLTPSPPSGRVEISQTGEVPAGMNALVLTRTSIANEGIVGPVDLSMNGQELKLIASSESRYFVYDVSGFSGHTVELNLSVRDLGGPFPSGGVIIDSVSFMVPEPTVGVLFFLGVLGLFAWRRRVDMRA